MKNVRRIPPSKHKLPIPRVLKSALGGYYVLSDQTYTQKELEEAYKKQNGIEVKNE